MLTTFLGKNNMLAQEMIEEILGKNLKKKKWLLDNFQIDRQLYF